jgi:hypothetical protein
MKNVHIDTRQIFDYLEDAREAIGKTILDGEGQIENFCVKTSAAHLVTGEDVIEWLYQARDHFEVKARLSS